MSKILNSYNPEDLDLTEYLMYMLAMLDIADAMECMEDLNYQLDHEFTVCCKSRMQFCECFAHGQHGRSNRQYDSWKDSQLEDN